MSRVNRGYEIHSPSLDSSSHLHFLQIIAGLQIEQGNVVRLPQHFKLHEPSFYKLVNRVIINNIEVEIPYQESFSIADEPAVPQFKTFTTTAEEPVENPTKGVFEYLKIINQRITGNLSANTPADSASRFFLYKLMA